MGLGRRRGPGEVAVGVAGAGELERLPDRVRALGCDIGQGALLARPLPADDVLPALRRLADDRSAVLGDDR